MTPKIRITREEIIAAAVEIVRRDGDAALNARSVAAELHCSTQPVFSNFASMEELRSAGVDTGGPSALSQSDRRTFANALDRLMVATQAKVPGS